MQPLRVFLSSAYRDAEWRKTARECIDSLPGFESLVIEDFKGSDVRAAIEQNVTKADLFVILVAPHHGKKNPRSAPSWLEYEYDVAVKAGKPALAFVQTGADSARPEPYSADLREFITRLEGETTVRFVTGTREFRAALTKTLINFKHENTDFEIAFDPKLSDHEVKAAFEALANYYRACGGVGFAVEFEHEEAHVRELIHV